jgi:hypothetical protein
MARIWERNRKGEGEAIVTNIAVYFPAGTEESRKACVWISIPWWALEHDITRKMRR